MENFVKLWKADPAVVEMAIANNSRARALALCVRYSWRVREVDESVENFSYFVSKEWREPVDLFLATSLKLRPFWSTDRNVSRGTFPPLGDFPELFHVEQACFQPSLLNSPYNFFSIAIVFRLLSLEQIQVVLSTGGLLCKSHTSRY